MRYILVLLVCCALSGSVSAQLIIQKVYAIGPGEGINSGRIMLTVVVRDTVNQKDLNGAKIELKSGKNTFTKIAGADFGGGCALFSQVILKDSLEFVVSCKGYYTFRQKIKSSEDSTSFIVPMIIKPDKVSETKN